MDRLVAAKWVKKACYWDAIVMKLPMAQGAPTLDLGYTSVNRGWLSEKRKRKK